MLTTKELMKELFNIKRFNYTLTPDEFFEQMIVLIAREDMRLTHTCDTCKFKGTEICETCSIKYSDNWCEKEAENE